MVDDKRVLDKRIMSDIETTIGAYQERDKKLRAWYELLIMIDVLKTNNMESYVSNEPQTFYNMAHYLLTKGEISHTTPIETEDALELDRRAKVHRSCQFIWKSIDRERQLGGSPPFIDELGFYLLVTGWYSVVLAFDNDTGEMQTQLWSPINVFPKYLGNQLATCTHQYELPGEEAKHKALHNGWDYQPLGVTPLKVVLSDHFVYEGDTLWNIIMIDGHSVTEWVSRPNMKLLVAPVGGFPDKGTLRAKGSSDKDWRRLAGRGIFEVNAGVALSMNKWKSQINQILRDTSNPITQEFSATPQATTEQLRTRGALFHYGPGEQGLERVQPPAIPVEVQNNLQELRREWQKGGFNDAVYGMVEGAPGYALSLLASSSANQILYPYMDGKHFVISEADKFWLTKIKDRKKVFQVKGKFLESLEPKDIPKDVYIEVESTVATPKDWLERGTIAGLLKDHLDGDTIITEIFEMDDPQAIKRRRSHDRIMENEVTLRLEMIAGYLVHADYLESKGDMKQAGLFRRAAESLEVQLGIPPAGSAAPAEADRVGRQRKEGAPTERPSVDPRVAPPEARSGFTPAQLRQSVGAGNITRR